MASPVILGVSIGTRRLGLAVGTHTELIEWHMKKFPETYSTRKSKKIWRAIELMIRRYGVSMLALQVPQKPYRSEGLNHIINTIIEESLTVGVPLRFYDIEEIKGHFIRAGASNKESLAEVLSTKHPELKKEYFKLGKGQYTIKIFEAVGALELALAETE